MREKHPKFLFLASALGVGLMAASPRAGAGVVVGDTFDIALVGFNAANAGAFVTSPVDATFGQTTAYSGDTLNGSTLTVSSSETVGPTLTTDTITLSVPANFVPTSTRINGAVVTQLELDIGGYNAGTDPLNLSVPLDPTTLTSTGSVSYSGGTVTLTPVTSVDATDTMVSAAEGVNDGSGNIGSLKVDSFTFSFSYANLSVVPEPSSFALLALGGLAVLFRYRLER